jgi:hypothetical protein
MKAANVRTSAITEKTVVFVPSCDKYSDLWKPFFMLFKRHWPDCPFQVYLGANELAYPDEKIITMTSNVGSNWSRSMIDYLSRLRSEYVILILEDFFIRRKVNSASIINCLDQLDSMQGDMLRLIPRPKPDHRIPGCETIGECDPESSYRVSTQAAIWRRESLLRLLVPGESIWQFEVDGSKRSAALGMRMLACWKPTIDYGVHVVEKGQWYPSQARLFRNAGIGCDFSKRKVLPWSHELRLRIIMHVRNAIYMLPAASRERVLFELKRVFRVKRASETKREQSA